MPHTIRDHPMISTRTNSVMSGQPIARTPARTDSAPPITCHTQWAG